MEVKHIGEGVPVSNLHKGFIWAESCCDAELMITGWNTTQVILWDELLLWIKFPNQCLAHKHSINVYSISKKATKMIARCSQLRWLTRMWLKGVSWFHHYRSQQSLHREETGPWNHTPHPPLNSGLAPCYLPLLLTPRKKKWTTGWQTCRTAAVQRASDWVRLINLYYN